MFASIGAVMTTLPEVRVVDMNGNPAAGQTVRFGHIEGDGTIEGALVTTGADERARLKGWSL